MAARITIAGLAREIGVDLDEMLVRLWDCGLEQFEDPADVVAGSELKQVLRALGMPGYSDLRLASWWLRRLGVTDQQLQTIVAASKLRWRPGMRLLPPGAPWALAGYGTSTAGARLAETEAVPPCRAIAGRVAEVLAPQERAQWTPVGAVRDHMRYLSVEEVLGIRRQIAQEFAKTEDPFFETGTHNAPLLESALSRPLTALGAQLKYPTVEMAAAALLHSLVLNHPFHDGNKRTGLVSMLVFLDENGFFVTCTDTELFKFVLQVAKHGLVSAEGPEKADIEVRAAAHWIARCSREIEHGERPMKWIRLKRILRRYGCAFSYPNVGNRLNIDRDVLEPAFLGMGKRRKHLHVQVQCSGEGAEADKSAVALIRKEMHLTDENGVDSRMFYDDDGGSVDDFIQIYRKTLHRLSKL